MAPPTFDLVHTRRWDIGGTRRFALIAAAVTFAGHLIANPHYGFFRDELYFIVCGRHPAFGYVDQPPLVPLAAALSQVFGTSLVMLRAVAALSAAVAVYASCLLAAELGGGTFALVLTAIGVAFAPALASFGGKVATDTFLLWTWPLAALYIVTAIHGRPRAWIAAGIVLGIALESKYSTVFFIVALLAGLLLTPQRKALRTRGFLWGSLAAALIALPNFAWQAVHGFPMIELLRNGQHGKNVVLSPLGYLAAQIEMTGLLLGAICLCGLVWLLTRNGTRWLGYAYILLIAMMIALHAKDYYPAAVYSILLAAGGVALEAWTARVRALRPIIAGLAVAEGLVVLPMVVPVLPVQALMAYTHALGKGPSSSEHHRMGVLSQDFADMHGWPEMVSSVARVYDSLPAQERRDTVVLADNYGEAAAVDVLGRPLGLPAAASGHNSYYLWGPRNAGRPTVIDINGDVSDARKVCATATLAATAGTSPYAMPYEQNVPIVLCRGLRISLGALWPRTKHYI